jgi:hypothetical protein
VGRYETAPGGTRWPAPSPRRWTVSSLRSWPAVEHRNLRRSLNVWESLAFAPQHFDSCFHESGHPPPLATAANRPFAPRNKVAELNPRFNALTLAHIQMGNCIGQTTNNQPAKFWCPTRKGCGQAARGGKLVNLSHAKVVASVRDWGDLKPSLLDRTERGLPDAVPTSHGSPLTLAPVERPGLLLCQIGMGSAADRLPLLRII